MDVDILRMMMLALLAIPAVADVRTRTVYSDMIIMCGAVAACFFVYDIASGNGRGMPWYGLMAVGIVMGFALSRTGVIGSADGHVMAIASVMMPEYGGIPVALLGIISGFVGSLAAMILLNVACNISDALGGRPYCGDIGFLTMHMKRAGERFTTDVAGPVRVLVRDDAVRTDDGKEYFVAEDARGMPVGVTVPAVAFIAAGVCAVSLFAAF